jgi:hypothetical protein
VNAKEGRLPFFCRIMGFEFTPFYYGNKGAFSDGEKTAKNRDY